MTTVRTTVNISVISDQMNMEELEAQIGEAMQLVGKCLLVQASRVVETQVLEECSELRRSKLLGMHLLTLDGWIRLTRWQVRDAPGRFFCPFDQVLGLQPRQHASPWVSQLCFQSPRRTMAANQDGEVTSIGPLISPLAVRKAIVYFSV